jgi:hypothetical protein
MARSKLKIAPTIADRTVQQDSDEEGMEAVLFHKKERRRQHNRSKGKYGGSEEDDDDSGIFESPQNTDLLDLVQRKKWETLMYRVLNEPHAAYVKFTGRSANSTYAGNLLLHEACKKNPPMDIIEALIESNETAVTTKGNSGYLPVHYACAHGASIQLIQLLLSIHPEAVGAVDDEEGILPLHLACRSGMTKEDVFMCLLVAFPEGSMVRDDYGRLPIDYAKSIRGATYRKIAIECLKRATWLEVAAKKSRDRTENEFHQRIKGYEQSQAHQLKLIEEVHTTEIAELEAKLESKDAELSERSHDLEELDKHLQEMTDEFRQRVESTDKATNAKNRKLQGQVDKAKKDATKDKEALELKEEEIVNLSLKLDTTRNLNDTLSEEVEQRTKELDLALDDIETMSKQTEWLKSVKESIKTLSTSEPPLLHNSPKKESFKKKKRSSSKKPSSGRKNKDSASVSSRRSEKVKRSSSFKLSSGYKDDDETRDSSFASRLIGSRRE